MMHHRRLTRHLTPAHELRIFDCARDDARRGAMLVLHAGRGHQEAREPLKCSWSLTRWTPTWLWTMCSTLSRSDHEPVGPLSVTVPSSTATSTSRTRRPRLCCRSCRMVARTTAQETVGGFAAPGSGC